MISEIENTLENRAQTTWKPEDDKMQDWRKGSSGFQNESISHPEAQGYCIRHFTMEHHFRLVQVDCGAALKKKKSPFVNSTLISNTQTIYTTW